ncbi:uncharacterized protein LAESUDRAFT_765101 [Laetiporus sulphureus 93-53]|uniref:Uncharacterized protein n=1 Tax=Laetiporus sulphureus 93-53 TaxID=1314785 RepID=A0A165AYW7_9APHY|nr:uncharacterized protein LAESUDRAFT_765101 [Laetiporus sulphureus 93-53]KZS99917.1 hypothetical protein LAESUDRAFT_765101 [Laetiporus sulphureus 93-53]
MRQQLNKLNGLAAARLLTLPLNHPIFHCLVANRVTHPPAFSLLNPNIPIHYGNMAVSILECELFNKAACIQPWLQSPWVTLHLWGLRVTVTLPPPSKEGSDDYLCTFFYPLLHTSTPSPITLWVFTDGSQVDIPDMAPQNWRADAGACIIHQGAIKYERAWGMGHRAEPQQDSELPKASKRKATPRIDLDAHYKRQETNKEHGRLLTLASLGASSTDRQRAAARVVDTTHIIKRGIIHKPRDHTPPLERYKPRKGHLTTDSRKPAPPPELITSNAVPPPVIAPIPTRPLPNFIKTNTIARPIRPLPSRVRPTIHIETLTKQVDATRFRLQPILGAFSYHLKDEHQKPIFSLATELDKVCADLHTGTRTYTFVEKQVINKVCLEIGEISFKQIGKEERLQEIAKALVFISKARYLHFLY